MYLASLRLRNVGPFDDVTIPFVDAEGLPRPVTVILGDSGAGKTTLLSAIASTRPGFSGAPIRLRTDVPASDAFVVARWRLGDDAAVNARALALADGSIAVPTGPGLGIEVPSPAMLERFAFIPGREISMPPRRRRWDPTVRATARVRPE